MNIAILHLHPSPSETEALNDTFRSFNRAKNHIADFASKEGCFNKHKLSEKQYYFVKNEFLLPAQLVISAISTVVEDKKKNGFVKEYGEFDDVFLDKRVVSYKGLTTASIATTIGRIGIKFTFDCYSFRDDFPKQIGCAILTYKYNPDYLFSLLSIIG